MQVTRLIKHLDLLSQGGRGSRLRLSPCLRLAQMQLETCLKNYYQEEKRLLEAEPQT